MGRGWAVARVSWVPSSTTASSATPSMISVSRRRRRSHAQDGPLACAALVLAEPGMRPLQLADGIKRVGCEVLFALSRREDRRDELIEAWRRVEPGDADAVEVFVEPRGPAPSFLFQPLLQGRVEDHELGALR